MTSVNLDEADLAGLLARVRTGEEIVIAENGVPIARLVPERAAPVPAPRRPGSGRTDQDPARFQRSAAGGHRAGL